MLLTAEEEVPEEKPVDTAPTRIDPEKLHEAWNSYVEMLALEKRQSLLNLMKNHKPAVEGAEIKIILNSRLSKELFDNERTKLAEFLESKLGVTGIALVSTVERKASTAPVKPFTAAEKFRRMAEENPAILELQKRLDLRLEH
jgi:hypothetical protein